MSFSKMSTVNIQRRLPPVEGGYNLYDGLRNWRQAAAYAKGDRAGTRAGGIDVLVLGDSIFAGSGATFISVDNVINRLRQDLQRRLNATDVAGGYGFIPIVANPPTPSFFWATFPGSGNMWLNGADADWEFHGLASAFTGEAGDSKGICRRHVEVASALSGQTAMWCSQRDFRINHSKQASTTAMNATAKQVQVVYLTKTGWGTFQWIHGGNSATEPRYTSTPPAPPTPPANTFSETVDCDGAESVGNRSSLSDVATSTAATHNVQIDQAEANNRIGIEGIISYVDDYDQGVRVHNLSCGGANSSNWNDAVTLAGLRKFGTPAGSPSGRNSTNAKLVIIEVGTNDNDTGASPTIDVATYKTNLTTLINEIQGWASEPDILLVYPPARNNTNAQNRWRDYILAGQALADAKNVAVLDLWAQTGYAAHGGNGAGGYMFDRGFYNDGVHYTKFAQDWFAQSMFGALMVGV
jgi:hypothetical protein